MGVAMMDKIRHEYIRGTAQVKWFEDKVKEASLRWFEWAEESWQIHWIKDVKTILVQMVSAAGTGYFFNTKRNRLRDKLVLRKHDPFVNKHVLFFEKRKIRSI
uniref:Large ribosomal subunit protein bL33m n=1 Tax=Astatotilapia calliptera TaxID=8154 RepID=A0AAX7V7T5_ASTCA